MKKVYDAIIVGAGPAGASCANELIKNNYEVLIVEEKRLPRFKCCSGMYSDRALNFINENFGDIPDNFFCKNKEYSLKVGKRGLMFFPIDKFKFYNLYREKVDYWLIQKSKANILDHCRFISFNEDKDLITVVLKKDKKEIKYSCKYLVGADGANSIVRKLKYKNDNINKGFAVQSVYKGDFKNIENNFFYANVNPEFSDYFSWFNVKDDLLYIGVGDYSRKNYLSKWSKFLIENFDFKINEIRKEGCFTVMYNKDNIYLGKNNVLLVGEAAGLMSVFNEGIPTALNSGKCLAQSIISNNNLNNLITNYRSLLDSEILLINKAWDETKLY